MKRFLGCLFALTLPLLASAQQIPLLPAASQPLSGNELTVIVQGGITKQTNVGSIAGTASLPSVIGNSVIGNSTVSATTGFDVPLPSCSGSANALTWISGTGFGCNNLGPFGTVSGPGTTTPGFVPTWANSSGTLLNNGLLASTTINGTVCALGSACAVTASVAAGGSQGQFQYNNLGGLSGFSGLTTSSGNLSISAPLTLPDGTTWTTSGLANTASYTTASTSVINVSPTWNFSSTSNGISALLFAPTLVPTGGSAGNLNASAMNAFMGTSAVNVSSLRTLAVNMALNAGYSGTVANASSLLINAPTISGTNPITVYNGITQASITNGTGLTTGTVTNTGYQINGITAVSGVGGTLLNTGISIAMPSGTNSGTTTSVGLAITGNGQTGGTTTNWAINSTSAANSQITGGLNSTPIGQTTAAAVAATTLSASSTVSGAGITSLFASPPSIGSTSAGSGAFTTLSASSTVSGTGFSTYLASPPAIGGTAPAAGTFTSLTANSQAAFGHGILTNGALTSAAASSIGLSQDGASTGALRIYGPTTSTYGQIFFAQNHSDGSGPLTPMLITTGQVVQISSGLANSVTLAGSATNPTIGTSGGRISLQPNNQVVEINASNPYYAIYNASQGTDLKQWRVGSAGASFNIDAVNDTYSALTNAYTINRGTTYNVASHIWYTSTTAGTAVQVASLSASSFAVGNGAYQSFQAISPGANLWVNFIQAYGNATGGGPTLRPAGSDTNIAFNLSSIGTGSVNFFTEANGKQQFAVLDNASGADYVTVTSGASAGAINTNAGNLTEGSAGGTTTHSDATQDMPNIASSAAALDAVCWNATGGVLTHNSAGALCSASLEELKDNLGTITAADASADLMALKPFWGKFKDSVISISDHREQPFFGAHQVEAVDPRLVEYDDDGHLRSVRYANITALLTAAFQRQEREIASLTARLSAVESAANPYPRMQ